MLIIQKTAHIPGRISLYGKACGRPVNIIFPAQMFLPFHQRNHKGGAQRGLPKYKTFQNSKIMLCAHLVYKTRTVKKRTSYSSVSHYKNSHLVFWQRIDFFNKLLVCNFNFFHNSLPFSKSNAVRRLKSASEHRKNLANFLNTKS